MRTAKRERTIVHVGNVSYRRLQTGAWFCTSDKGATHVHDRAVLKKLNDLHKQQPGAVLRLNSLFEVEEEGEDECKHK